MNKIRQILLTQHIGAITIGLILAQAVLGFVNALVQAGATYWAIQQAGSALTGSRDFSWTNLIAAMVSVALFLLICLWLIRWLYFESSLDAADSSDSQNGTSEP
jgi:high-affinity Fe2+/Pb2+ permease